MHGSGREWCCQRIWPDSFLSEPEIKHERNFEKTIHHTCKQRQVKSKAEKRTVYWIGSFEVRQKFKRVRILRIVNHSGVRVLETTIRTFLHTFNALSAGSCEIIANAFYAVAPGNRRRYDLRLVPGALQPFMPSFVLNILNSYKRQSNAERERKNKAVSFFGGHWCSLFCCGWQSMNFISYSTPPNTPCLLPATVQSSSHFYAGQKL